MNAPFAIRGGLKKIQNYSSRKIKFFIFHFFLNTFFTFKLVLRLASELKLKQHLNVHEEGFEVKLRQKLDEITAIDINDVSSNEKDEIWAQFDLKCDNCTVQFQSLNDAQVHYFNEHNIARGYLKCCDMKLREDNMVKEHIAYHKNPTIY